MKRLPDLTVTLIQVRQVNIPIIKIIQSHGRLQRLLLVSMTLL